MQDVNSAIAVHNNMQGAIVTSSDRGGMRLQYPFIAIRTINLNDCASSAFSQLIEAFFCLNLCLHIQRTRLGGKKIFLIHLMVVHLVYQQILMGLLTIRPAGQHDSITECPPMAEMCKRDVFNV